MAHNERSSRLIRSPGVVTESSYISPKHMRRVRQNIATSLQIYNEVSLLTRPDMMAPVLLSILLISASQVPLPPHSNNQAASSQLFTHATFYAMLRWWFR
jgi:hypothetical protein